MPRHYSRGGGFTTAAREPVTMSGFNLDDIRERFDRIRKQKAGFAQDLQRVANIGTSDVARIKSVGLGELRGATAGLRGVEAEQDRFDLGESKFGRDMLRNLLTERTGRDIRNLRADLPATPDGGRTLTHEEERLRGKRDRPAGVLPDIPTGRFDIDAILGKRKLLEMEEILSGLPSFGF